MLLARQGHRILLVDRATFPSDTISTHLIHPPGVDALKRWNLIDRLTATGCPPIHSYKFDLGPFVVEGTPGGPASPVSYAPRRTVLDKLLIDAAAAAGVEVREGFTVDEVTTANGSVTGIRGHAKGGSTVTARARLVVGADGLHSQVARSVRPEGYHERPQLQAGYYTYWSGLDMGGCFEAYDRGTRCWAAWPTHDDMTLVVVSWPFAEFETNKQDIERYYLGAFDRAPAFAERVKSAKREERFFGTAVPNYYRKPFGPGWALVGDAGHNKDFITAQGITDAFRDAELCARATGEWLSGASSYDVAMGAYQATRDRDSLPLYEFTCEFARLAPPPPEQQQLMAAVHGNPDAMNGFVRVISGVVSPAEFFAPENVGRIFAAAGKSPGPS
jgi:2-polyprenyl-6-methoxyphenol hydroxylase-like FAD-dependent oxidoreductase